MSLNKMVFCTLFDSNYLDKGLALYHSLTKVCVDFSLYVFAFDTLAYQTLKKMNLENVVVINICDIEDEKMRIAKEGRSRGEYCWTCTPIIIEYVLEHFDVSACTYLDSDLYFYASPQILFAEMEKDDASVLITPHNYYNCIENRLDEKYKGKYCVQFNVFKNDKNGRTVLNWWKEKCLECCPAEVMKEIFGDQKYLDFFCEFPGVCSSENKGMIAPWNIARWKNVVVQGQNILLTNKKETCEVVFYHFHNIKYLDPQTVDIRTFVRPGSVKQKVVWQFYIQYLQLIEQIRDELFNEYGIDLRTCQKPVVGGNGKKIRRDEVKPNLLLRGVLRLRKEYRHFVWHKKDCINLNKVSGRL